jgi:hypothetical protein
MDAPPPSSEYTVVLEQPFNKHDIAPSKRIEIIGEPNRSASIKVTERTGENLENIIEHEGSIDRYNPFPFPFPFPPLPLSRPPNAQFR